MLFKWKFDNFFIHFDRGDKKTEWEKKNFFLKCITKSNVIKKIWVLLISFMYLVLFSRCNGLIIECFVWCWPLAQRDWYRSKKNFIWILIQAFYSAVLLLLSKDPLSHWVFNNQFFFSNFCVTNVYEFLFESSTAYFYGKRFVQLFYYLIFLF